ncbi:MAG: hypothetical protein OEZ01_00705 [Candidatus Heimdallarchaeota archaeon]|nr:hypothetical protein [Candidatus Heimdallarchaeota archaeon]MDH5644492.1 hypothetical protein [Candidatus Heimdallarchaeota archaeon]
MKHNFILDMSIGERLENTLMEFEAKTDGILGSCVMISSQALMMAEASQNFDRGVIQGMSVKLMRLAKETLESLWQNPGLQSITIEENDHVVYVRPVNSEYHIVVVTDKSEVQGLREMNLKQLIAKVATILS